jgi:hypothetical protein
MDRFFGGNRNFQESNKTMVQLNLVRTMGTLGNERFALSGRAKLDLPATASRLSRLHLLFESDPDKNVTGVDTPGQQVTPTTTTTPGPTAAAAPVAAGTAPPESYSGALRYEQAKEEEREKHFSAEAGLKFNGIVPSLFGRTRGSYSVPMGLWRLKAAETAFWFNTTGTGETTQIDVERAISDPLLFRATSTATWLWRTLNFDLRQDLTLFQTLNERDAMQYQASIVGVSRPDAYVTDSSLTLLYRHRLHRSWMFFELSPQLHFPQSRDYRLSTLIIMRLQMNFDQSR